MRTRILATAIGLLAAGLPVLTGVMAPGPGGVYSQTQEASCTVDGLADLGQADASANVGLLSLDFETSLAAGSGEALEIECDVATEI